MASRGGVCVSDWMREIVVLHEHDVGVLVQLGLGWAEVEREGRRLKGGMGGGGGFAVDAVSGVGIGEMVS